MDEKVCAHCGLKDGQFSLDYCGGKRAVKIIDSRYGQLCERCAHRSSSRCNARSRRSQALIDKRAADDLDTGQMKMFGEV